MKKPFVVVALVAIAGVASAQAPQAPQGAGQLSSALLAAWMRASQNMPAAADLMPPDKFSFKPTPEQMSFG